MTEPEVLSRSGLRSQLRAARRGLSRQAQQQASRRLFRRIAQRPEFRRARRIAFYLSNDGELDTTLLLKEALRRGKLVFLPLVRTWPAGKMVLQRIRQGEQWRLNRFAIAEPIACPARQRPAWVLDLMLLPLVGFDPHGGRLGMGGGFYDRCLAYRARRQSWQKPRLWGIAHECQKVARLPLAAWDVALDATLSDRAYYPNRPEKANPRSTAQG